LAELNKQQRWEAVLSAAHYLVFGEGEWASGSESTFGKPIYKVSVGSVEFVFSQLGLTYQGCLSVFQIRYDEIESIDGPTLTDYMTVRGNCDKELASELRLRSVPTPIKLRFPARLGWVVSLLSQLQSIASSR
jgi:hypothetical protein